MHFPNRLVLAALLYALSATTAQAQQARGVTIGWGAYADVPQIAQAADKNLWKDEGIAAKIVPFASGRESLEALLGGQLDFAIVTEFPVTTGSMRNQKFGALAVLSRFRGGRIIGVGDIGMSSVKDLAGRKIGTIVGGNWHFALDDLLQKNGIKAEFVNIAQSDTIAALVRGDVQASGMFPTGYSAAKRILGDRYREIRFPDYAPLFVLIATQDIIDKQADVARRVLAALIKGEALVAKNPAESQEAVSRFVGKAMTLEAIREAWSEYEFSIKLDRATVELLAREGRWIRDRGLIKNVDPTEALFRSYIRDAPLRAVAPERVTLN
ncbi:MAG: ABC transporter substrate-binding protein [Betaproteobacteria bacterium]|nr:ABC transporter substrate-binding protein [Betaproteobacteria bacterium]